MVLIVRQELFVKYIYKKSVKFIYNAVIMIDIILQYSFLEKYISQAVIVIAFNRQELFVKNVCMR